MVFVAKEITPFLKENVVTVYFFPYINGHNFHGKLALQLQQKYKRLSMSVINKEGPVRLHVFILCFIAYTGIMN